MTFDLVWRKGQMSEKSAPEIPSIAAVLLASGHLLKVRSVKLFPSSKLEEITRIRQEAATKLGGFSSGIGFLGSPGWAIGGALALGLLEKAVSASARTEGLAMLQDAEYKSRSLPALGMMFPVGKIAGREEPLPSLWSARSSEGVSYAHDGGDFVAVDTSAGEMKIRWQHVASYSVVREEPVPAIADPAPSDDNS